MSSSLVPRLREPYIKVTDAIRMRAAQKPSCEADASQWNQWGQKMDGPIAVLNEVLPALRVADRSFVMDGDVLLAITSLERWRLEQHHETPAPGDPLPAALLAVARTPSPPPRMPSLMAISPPHPATPVRRPSPPVARPATPAMPLVVPPPRLPSPEVQITGSTMNPNRRGDDGDLVEVVGIRAAQPVMKKEKGGASRKGKGKGGESKNEKLEYYEGSDGQERVRTVAGHELGLFANAAPGVRGGEKGERCSGVFGHVCTRCSDSHVQCTNQLSCTHPAAGSNTAGPSSSRAAPRETLVARASLKHPATIAPSETRLAHRRRHALGNPGVREALNEFQQVTATLFVLAGRLLTMTVPGELGEEEEEEERRGSGAEEDGA
ncbi:hypothetical protein Hypma_006023 [Hypsizygus marmoreus]|uniref:Uncharacterized protein n=1 Tax=Hypsizygus marmoreus TaxID=39966 RepID=A0A369JXG2_HYPMA|nr:hypothetical protein Hypma_006023 [Hypsizygus marmoreus]